MSFSYTENFSASDGTALSSYNSWTVLADSTNAKIYSNQAQEHSTSQGTIRAYNSVSSAPSFPLVITYTQWSGTGGTGSYGRYPGIYFKYGNTTNNDDNSGIIAGVGQSDSTGLNAKVFVYDGSTAVINGTASAFTFGQSTTNTITINSDGSGSILTVSGANSQTMTWGVRSWTTIANSNVGMVIPGCGSTPGYSGISAISIAPPVTALSVSVSDTETATENTTLLISQLFVSVSDTETETENISSLLVNPIPLIIDIQSYTEIINLVVSAGSYFLVDTENINESVVLFVLDNIFISETESTIESISMDSIRYSPRIEPPIGDTPYSFYS